MTYTKEDDPPIAEKQSAPRVENLLFVVDSKVRANTTLQHPILF